jgi:hypothetical protein
LSKVYLGDTGTLLVLDTLQSLAGATAVSIEARRPNGTTVSWAGTVVESTKVQHTSLAGTFDLAGDWKLQARVTLPTGTWAGEAVALRVYRLFE